MGDMNSREILNFNLGGKIALAIKDKDGNIISSQKLSSNAWGIGKTIDAGKIDCDYFKVSCIAVYNEQGILDVKKIEDGENADDITNNMYQRFGADIEIAYNFDGFNVNNDEHYKYVGWLNLDKIVNITEEQKLEISKVDSTDKASILIKSMVSK